MAKGKKAAPTQLEFDFIKSNFFRVIHADGAFGGLGPRGDMHMQFFSERRAIPTKIVHAIDGTKLGPEIKDKRESREAFVREVEVDVVMNMAQVRSLHKWLGDKIAEFQKIAETEQSSVHRNGAAKDKSQ
jgi:hypothetical protein